MCLIFWGFDSDKITKSQDEHLTGKVRAASLGPDHIPEHIDSPEVGRAGFQTDRASQPTLFWLPGHPDALRPQTCCSPDSRYRTCSELRGGSFATKITHLSFLPVQTEVQLFAPVPHSQESRFYPWGRGLASRGCPGIVCPPYYLCL